MNLTIASPLFAALLLIAACSGPADPDARDPHIASLADLSVDSLRKREYRSKIRIESCQDHDTHDSYIASYDSDGLHVYARVDVPSSPAPAEGFPVVIFVHGWVGIDGAPDLDFYYDADSDYGQMINAYVDAGFVVFTPGWRGHGTVNGVPADGIEFVRAWDNGSYLSPVFYAIDALNLLDGLSSFDKAPLNLGRINTVSHSQGGDVALIAMAVAGEESAVRNEIHAASFWSGTFPNRFTQLETYWPMQKSPEAFMSGDGTWNGTARGVDGSVNLSFVFGYPPDWIGTVDAGEWTWQKDMWSISSVSAAVAVKLDQMYDTINKYVTDIDDAAYQIAMPGGQAFAVLHDERVAAAMRLIDAFDQPEYLSEPFALQHSDRDFYSFPDWNADLCERTNHSGGRCYDFEYAGNTHSLRISEHAWFSGEHREPGFSVALQRDIALFSGRNPAEIGFP